jgi:hypothetical protein
MSASVAKQVAINQLYKMPLEVLDIVKSYLFYDVQTALVRHNKEQVRDQISLAVSRYNCDNDDDIKYGVSVFWYFGLDQMKGDKQVNFRIQGFCCKKCGNYMQAMLSVYPEAATCHCIEEGPWLLNENENEEVEPLWWEQAAQEGYNFSVYNNFQGLNFQDEDAILEQQQEEAIQDEIDNDPMWGWI